MPAAPPAVHYQPPPLPAVAVLTSAELVAQSRILDEAATAEAALLERLIAAATQYVERHTRRALITRSIMLQAAHFPAGRLWRLYPVAPITGISALQYRDEADQLQSLPSDQWHADTIAEPATLHLADGACWPSTRRRPDAVQIAATAGYGASASTVPDDLRHAISMLAAHFYEHREARAEQALHEVPLAVDAILGHYSRPEAH
jgi:uncharacterized phiE125 gp8 family phage protein